MRIDSFGSVTGVYGKKGVYKPQTVAKSGSLDKVEISRFGMDYQVARSAVAKTPDIREAKVADIKAMLSSNSYNVSIEDVADKLVGNL
ncbi:MAG TPA: flagellar biosynthesis anti-sigma factor FlgM [Eubacterium sp.]|jgi:negative regulator of flagellin synthesis FlgM|nr:flagellar biosynthesis anti-sigma factor FlgM [Eubacterium sp.]HBZ52573.1 flagellar biosynthesis anti-sigma factor FlgM [Eubacterium sp.]